MIVETEPFPYLKPGQYIGFAYGEIVIFGDTIPEEEKERYRELYRAWWEEKQKRRREEGRPYEEFISESNCA